MPANRDLEPRNVQVSVPAVAQARSTFFCASVRSDGGTDSVGDGDAAPGEPAPAASAHE